MRSFPLTAHHIAFRNLPVLALNGSMRIANPRLTRSLLFYFFFLFFVVVVFFGGGFFVFLLFCWKECMLFHESTLTAEELVPDFSFLLSPFSFLSHHFQYEVPGLLKRSTLVAR